MTFDETGRQRIRELIQIRKWFAGGIIHQEAPLRLHDEFIIWTPCAEVIPAAIAAAT
jgi:hypothetical protein